ncbi:MAG: divalent-cation tolerance protein CutA [Alphaproteobacteria bacterium]|nr:divalent-cation tolerance protein CutA [Alphaproteobacteria bacterium]
MPDQTIIFIYIPCRDADEAAGIARAMVEQKLAACGNIFPAIQSIYKWEGEVRSDTEAVLILKTTQAKFKVVEGAVKALHSYDTPCIAALNVADVNDAYRTWLLGEIAK